MKLAQRFEHTLNLPSITRITLAFVSLSLIVKLCVTLWLQHYLFQAHLPSKQFTYVGEDYPETWHLAEPRRQVQIAFENTKRYELDTPQGAEEWARLVPGDGLVYLGEKKRPFSISLFHQLRCLDVLREEIVSTGPVRKLASGEGSAGGNGTSVIGPAVASAVSERGASAVTNTGAASTHEHERRARPPSELARHCLNYVKQMIMCRGDVHLESFNYASHIDPIDQSGEWECRDWEAVYREARRR